jgi:probable F420-dependent oxidoreductase
LGRSEWADQARRIEDTGFSTLLVPDHFDERFAPMPALVAAAQVTSALRVGTLVIGNDYRHPLLLAKEAATVDVLTDGRFEFGIGAGWERRDYDWSGIPFDPARTRVDRLEESVAILKGLWADGPFTHHGRHYDIEEHEGTPKPVQRPHPPMLIGAGGKRMLELAASEADIVSVNFRLDAGRFGADSASTGTAAATQQKLDWLRQAAGERFDCLELSVTIFAAVVTDQREDAARMLGRAFGLTAEETLASPHLLVGSIEQIAEELQHRREQFGFSYVAFALDTWQAMSPVVEQLAGT